MQEKVVKLISDFTSVDVAKVTPEADFVEDLNLDSLDVVELIMNMEDEFGVEIPEEDAANMKVVQDLITYIENKK